MLRNTQNLRSSRGHVETAGLGNTRKKWNEIKASGIDAEVNEIDTIIEELIRKENAAVSTGGVDKKKVEEEKKAAKKNREKAMERLGESSKRCGADGEVEVKKKKKKSRLSEAVEFLREKAKLDHSLREEELQLRKDQQSQTLVLLQEQQQINQVLLSLMEKMVEKQKKK